MLRYTLRRILLMLPTLVVISLLAFALNECTPEDVDEPIRGESRLTALERYDDVRKNQQNLAELRGNNLPIFYFGIHSAAYPDTLQRILPRSRQKTILALIGRYGNWPAIQAYTDQIERTTRAGLRLTETHSSDALIETNRLLSQLYNQEQDKDIERNLEKVQQQLEEDSVLQATLQPVLTDLKTSFQQLTAQQQNWKHYVPRFQWNGTQNQYHRWLALILQGQLGTSLVNGQEVRERVSSSLRWTLRLNLSAFLLAYLIAIPLGVYSAAYAGSGFDRRLNIFLFFIYALPSFWVATLLTQFLASPEWLDLFPSMGVGEVADNASWWERSRVRIYHFFLPVFCLTYGILAVVTRQVRTAMQAILQSDYIRTARAMGLSERRVIWRHAFPNAMFPLITMFGALLPGVIAGSIIIELIFNIPGIGLLTLDSIYNKDWPVVYALLLITAILTVIGILIADLLYAWVDPRVQLGRQNQNTNG